MSGKSVGTLFSLTTSVQLGEVLGVLVAGVAFGPLQQLVQRVDGVVVRAPDVDATVVRGPLPGDGDGVRDADPSALLLQA